jgi:UDP-GlcNAc:undecaprenyl-phosphate/decaprenyl-phosphate GlcNAc-1-phosphate transferase
LPLPSDPLAAAMIALGVTVVLESVVIRELTRRSILDLPVDRSSHTVPTPRGGGIAVMAGVLVGVLVTGDPLAVGLLAGILGAAAVGLLEDVHGAGVSTRLLLTTVAALALVVGLVFTGLPAGLTGGLIAALALPWTLAVVNAVNFMDGINGITAVTTVVVGASYAWLGGVSDHRSLTVLGLVVAAAGLGFAPYNAPRARVFLGDVGSYGLGAAFAAMSLLAVAGGLPLVAAVAPLAVYLADTGTTLLRRVRAGEPWRLPHKRHVYQRLVALGLPHTGVSAAVGVLTAGCAALGAVSRSGSSATSVGAGVALLGLLAAYLAAPRLVAARVAARVRTR